MAKRGVGHWRKIILVGSLGIGVVGMLAGCRPVQRAPLITAVSPIKVSLAKPDDRAVVGVEDGRTFVEFFSPSGIGRADLTWTAEHPPVALVLRLHTKGLEGLTVTAGDTTVNASVASSPPHTVSAAMRTGTGTQEQALTPDSPTWIDITIVADQVAGEAIIPLRNGYFDAVIPPALVDGGQGRLTVQWIDFYR